MGFRYGHQVRLNLEKMRFVESRKVAKEKAKIAMLCERSYDALARGPDVADWSVHDPGCVKTPVLVESEKYNSPARYRTIMCAA
jgi:hypothetical protein